MGRLPAREDAGVAQHLLELADVAGPAVQEQGLVRPDVEGARVVAQEVAHEQADVFGAVAERRDHEPLRAEPGREIEPDP